MNEAKPSEEEMKTAADQTLIADTEFEAAEQLALQAEAAARDAQTAVRQVEAAAADAGAAEESALHAEASAEAAAREAHSAVEHMEAAAEAAAEEKAAIELFELCTALLLAVGAIFASLASYQNGLWGGASVQAYSSASIQTTKAAEASAMANALIGHDLHVLIEAKRTIWQALVHEPGDDRDLLFHQAGYLLLKEMGDEAYEDLELPDEETRSVSIVGSDEIQDEAMAGITHRELSPEYYVAMYKDSKDTGEEVERLTRTATTTSTVSDQFSLVGVFYTVSLALSGIGLVFKTRVRWAFFCVGVCVFIVASFYMSRLQWM